jgi:hypothetical protein
VCSPPSVISLSDPEYTTVSVRLINNINNINNMEAETNRGEGKAQKQETRNINHNVKKYYRKENKTIVFDTIPNL